MQIQNILLQGYIKRFVEFIGKKISNVLKNAFDKQMRYWPFIRTEDFINNKLKNLNKKRCEYLNLFCWPLKTCSKLQGCRKWGGWGGALAPQLLADQLTLSRPGGGTLSTPSTTSPPGFSALATALNYCR